jgi:Amt family ammonium transporter
VWINTTVATCAAMLGWLLMEKLRDGHATSIGAASGVVAGWSPSPPPVVRSRRSGRSSSGLSPVSSRHAVGLKFRFGFDDSLDVVGVHLVAGLWGTIGAGLLSTSHRPPLRRGLKQTSSRSSSRSSPDHLRVVTTAIALALKATMGWRITEDAETAGIDQREHAETAYDLNSGGGAAGHLRIGSGLTTPATARASSRKEPRHEARHRHHQAAPARRGQGRPGGLRRSPA